MRTAAATAANMQRAAERNALDPVKLARAARIVRVGLARRNISLSDIVDEPPLCDCRECSPAESAVTP